MGLYVSFVNIRTNVRYHCRLRPGESSPHTTRFTATDIYKTACAFLSVTALQSWGWVHNLCAVLFPFTTEPFYYTFTYTIQLIVEL